MANVIYDKEKRNLQNTLVTETSKKTLRYGTTESYIVLFILRGVGVTREAINAYMSLHIDVYMIAYAYMCMELSGRTHVKLVKVVVDD